ncbi:precorrin-2 C(20)-methyltransferase, partial [Clostridium sp.]
ECLNLTTPMTKDKAVLNAAYQAASDQIIEQLEQGKDVACLTLGDPTIYSTYIYIHRIVKAHGYATEIINGIPSFCAVSAKLQDSLVDRSEQLHIIPSTYDIEAALELPGTKVLMKAASKMPLVKATLKEKHMTGTMIENCGMPEEHIYHKIDEIPDRASYYSIIVVKEGNHD